MSSFTVYILLISKILNSEKQKNSGKTELVIGVNTGPGPPPSWGESASSAVWQGRRLKLWPLGHLRWKERRPSCWPPRGDYWLPDKVEKWIHLIQLLCNRWISDIFIGMEERGLWPNLTVSCQAKLFLQKECQAQFLVPVLCKQEKSKGILLTIQVCKG